MARGMLRQVGPRFFSQCNARAIVARCERPGTEGGAWVKTRRRRLGGNLRLRGEPEEQKRKFGIPNGYTERGVCDGHTDDYFLKLKLRRECG